MSSDILVWDVVGGRWGFRSGWYRLASLRKDDLISAFVALVFKLSIKYGDRGLPLFVVGASSSSSRYLLLVSSSSSL